MIAYEDLVAALDNWRLRSGLPLGTTEVPARPIEAAAPRAVAAPVPVTAPAFAPAPAPFVMPTAAAATSPRPVSTTARAGTDSDVMSLDDAEVEDAMYENEGSDFSMSFGGSGNPVGSVSGSIGGATPLPPAAVVEPAPAVAYAEGVYDDPAYDEPVSADAVEASEDLPVEDEPEEDWSKLPGFPGAPGQDTLDAEQDVIDEETVVGTDTPKR